MPEKRRVNSPVKSKRRHDPLAVLAVIDRLEIGPIRLTKRRLAARYRVVSGSRTAETELLYRFEEDVFDPQEAASKNLAAMIAAQVALNYGLFCREIVFHGFYDDADRKFLNDMAANTAREIYVKKFLEPNPFLIGAATTFPCVRKRSYLRARLRFVEDNESARRRNDDPAEWAVTEKRHAVLSSGGKDSLLTFSILDEMGCETHPIFINESGRHWHTALNAYRHFARFVPNTARVWSNCDRVFSFMLRQLPFIRSDFHRLRADDYPIRLWTVAVFLFGALPLMRKRGIGRLYIGNEYDTSRRCSHRGIPHYDGLFDQSRWFDNYLTRYFRRKGWGIRQLSILRPLSEFLIQKVLLQRYDALQRQQVSCHATHIVRGRVRPCGTCEKCRRIMAMLSALNRNSRQCGYTRSQIASSLKTIAGTRLNQENQGVQHILYLLKQRGLLPPGDHDDLYFHPEIESLRFHPRLSPLEEWPSDLRRILLAICLQHAHGSLRQEKGHWSEFSPLPA